MRRDLLLRRPRRRLELSCERLYMQYADARSEARLGDFLAGVARDLAAADAVRVTAREWLGREDFRMALEPLLRARGLITVLVLTILGGSACSNTATGKSASVGADA